MSRQIQIRRGTTTQHENFTGAIGEITMDTTTKTIRVHDGETPGGIELARADSVLEFELPENMDYVIETQAPTSANNYTWYRKYNSGWVEQGGLYNKTSSTALSYADVNITLPITMMNNNYQGFLNGWRVNDVAYGTTCRLIPTSTSVVVLQCYNIYGSSSQYINWEVKGFMAT